MLYMYCKENSNSTLFRCLTACFIVLPKKDLFQLWFFDSSSLKKVFAVKHAPLCIGNILFLKIFFFLKCLGTEDTRQWNISNLILAQSFCKQVLVHTYTRQSVLCSIIFDPQNPVCLTSVIASNHIMAQYSSLALVWLRWTLAQYGC